MKTKLYTTAMLIALVFATASIQAQPARRPMTQEKERTKATKARSTQTTRKVESQRSPQKKAAPARKVNTQQVRHNQTKAPARKNQAMAPVRKANTQQVRHNQAKAPVRKNQAMAPARKANTTQVRHNQAKAKGRNLSTPVHRPVSMSTVKKTNTRSRTARNNSYATPRYSAPKHTVKYHKNHYYGGHHYHYAYPTSKVRIHYHHDTYRNHFRVLYYPSYNHIYWDRHMYRNYRKWYPDYHWNYNYGYRIQTISVFDAQYNLGEVATVYGRVYATWHNKESDDYLLFFGGDFPYQQFTVVLPGYVARKFSWRPAKYFLGEHIITTGLITTFDGSPEMVVKNKRQIGIY